MAEMCECANRGMGFGHRWLRNIDYTGDFYPDTIEFTVVRRRWDICNPQWGGCGFVRCYMFGKYAVEYKVRYDYRTGLQYDKKNGEVRPTAEEIQAWLLGGVPKVVTEVQRRKSEKAKRKAAA